MQKHSIQFTLVLLYTFLKFMLFTKPFYREKYGHIIIIGILMNTSDPSVEKNHRNVSVFLNNYKVKDLKLRKSLYSNLTFTNNGWDNALGKY